MDFRREAIELVPPSQVPAQRIEPTPAAPGDSAFAITFKDVFSGGYFGSTR
jgi:hypothetical protein